MVHVKMLESHNLYGELDKNTFVLSSRNKASRLILAQYLHFGPFDKNRKMIHMALSIIKPHFF